MSTDSGVVVRDMTRWLERAVIGLNLCPFAKAPHVKGQVHFAVSGAQDAKALLGELGDELDALASMEASVRETTLLVVPELLPDFLAFNDFLARAERLVRKRGLEGAIQLASFHPEFQFEGTEADDITNFTNRAPYPAIHLLREDSISRAVVAFPDPAVIYENNMKTLAALGYEGWTALGVERTA
ncbi:DUF1415 domain-containing protein [Caenimonas aquaedulcis]|uniref:DUF1415 domain-containing protein n=1 Tax=Caenimonas aquaedulcis TaxID=2793270 RepID=A0A931MIE1_9BURK|nr:DUF1415 domain-containing protein [Caenimonas aquaedulcis]MBG9389703.1 DUF1415 domain-containing protein [Caenimonas aquaedulcis]